MNAQRKNNRPVMMEAMESRLFMSAVPTVIDMPVAGQRFAPITVQLAAPAAKPSAHARWLKVKLVNTLTGKTALTRTFFPKAGQAVVVNNLVTDKAGDYDVVTVDSLGQKSTVEEVTVVPAAPHELWFSTQPRVLDEDAIVTVTVLDQYGNMTDATDGEEVVLHSWLPKGTPGPAPVLTGAADAVVVNGMATFTGLSMNQTGKAHLIARLDGLKPTVSNVFHAGATLNIVPPPTGGTA